MDFEPSVNSFERDFILMVNNPIKSPSGGFVNIWIEGDTFRGALSLLNTSEVMLAQAQTGIAVGVLAVNKVYEFPINTYFKDPRNENYYRVASPGQTSAESGTFNQTQYNVVYVENLPA